MKKGSFLKNYGFLICMLLGIGGIRALNAMGIRQDVYHCNEGHAAFTGIERIRNLIHNDKLSFSEALEVVRSSCAQSQSRLAMPAGCAARERARIRLSRWRLRRPQSIERAMRSRLPCNAGVWEPSRSCWPTWRLFSF